MNLFPKFRVFIFFSVFVLCINLLSADSIDVQAASDARLDSILNATSKAVEELDRHYVSTLEKTNSQLSLYLNPYAIFIAALGVLFTAGAIAAGYHIYSQGKDFKDRQDMLIARNEAIIHSTQETLNTQQQEHIKTIGQLNEELESIKDEGFKTINDLNTIKASLLNVLNKNEKSKDELSDGINIFMDQNKKFNYVLRGNNRIDLDFNVPINETSILSLSAVLERIDQPFNVYLRFNKTGQKPKWIGFAINGEANKNYNTEWEKTTLVDSNTQHFQINIPIFEHYKICFPNDSVPKYLSAVRLRGQIKPSEIIRVSFEIVNVG
jgi:hypothetical protein